MIRNPRCKLITLKSDKEIEFYLEHGPKFGHILKILEKEIRTRKLNKYNTISNRFIKLCNKTWPNDNIKFPFAKVMNFDLEKFLGSICISINDTLAHGKDSNFKPRDIISIDCGIAIEYYKRFLNFDSAFTTRYGGFYSPNPWILGPLRAIKTIASIKDINNIGTAEIAYIIQTVAKKMNLQVVTSVVGHGIGRQLHEPPDIHNAIGEFTSKKLINNMCFCVEPVFVLPAGNKEKFNISRTYIDSDGWSIKSESGQPGSHFETMFCVHKNKLVDITGISKWI